MNTGRSRRNKTGRRVQGRFLALSGELLDSAQWANLSAFEAKLLIDIAAQYRGNNNGDLCASLTVLKKRGWKSSATLNDALKGLRTKGWIELTRQGGRHQPSLYAITWCGIDFCGGKLDVAPNPVPSMRWKVDGLSSAAHATPRAPGSKPGFPTRDAPNVVARRTDVVATRIYEAEKALTD